MLVRPKELPGCSQTLKLGYSEHAFSTKQIRGVSKRSSVWMFGAMLGTGEGRAGTSSFKWKASRDHYVHPWWPETENPTHLQPLRGLSCSTLPVPRSYSRICFPGSKLFLRQTESQFPCMWAEPYERLACFSSFTFCSQMAIPHPGKEQGWCLQGQGYTCIFTALSLCLYAEGRLPQDTAPAAVHWLGRHLSCTFWPRSKLKDIWVLFAWVTLD